MSIVPTVRGWLRAIARPETSPELEAALAARRERVPVLWLLGKTGAGKTSIVQRLSGDSRAEIGNGFEPCTAAASLYDHPREQPVMRFLDTRGLGEPRYDPREDLAACRSASHALLIVTRIDDPSQGTVTAALERLGDETRNLAVLHVHSALHAVPDATARRRAVAHNARAVTEALGRAVPGRRDRLQRSRGRFRESRRRPARAARGADRSGARARAGARRARGGGTGRAGPSPRAGARCSATRAPPPPPTSCPRSG